MIKKEKPKSLKKLKKLLSRKKKLSDRIFTTVNINKVSKLRDEYIKIELNLLQIVPNNIL